jgi:hypothetical protein
LIHDLTSGNDSDDEMTNELNPLMGDMSDSGEGSELESEGDDDDDESDDAGAGKPGKQLE